MNNRVMHFDLNSPDTDKTIAFYSEVFGWKFENYTFGEDAFWGITTGKEGVGINGGMVVSPDGIASMVNVIDVSDIDAYVEKVVQNGGTIVVPKMPVEGMGYCAYFKDPTGIFLGVFQNDENAK